MELLARREHSRGELKDKLTRRGFDGGTVDGVLDALERQQLLSDRRFAWTFVESRAARGVGPVRILEELRQRGVDRATRDLACDPRDRRWTELACRERGRKFGTPPPVELRERARQARFLTRRGFSRVQIAAALGGDPDDFDC